MSSAISGLSDWMRFLVSEFDGVLGVIIHYTQLGRLFDICVCVSE
jgi:hypothetical protein